MIFQPVLNVLLLVLFLAPVAALTMLGIVRAKNGGARTLWIARTLLVAVCFLALLRPGIPGGGTAQTMTTNTDILLVVDTTSSIAAEDWGTDDAQRLAGVRADVQSVIDTYPGARFALITFDAQAKLQLPFTTDSTALNTALKVQNPEVTSNSRGSSIGIAADLVAKTLEGAAKSSADRSRMVFYFGDGEQTVDSDPESFEKAQKYTDGGAVFGYGTAEGGPMRVTIGNVNGESDEYIMYQGSEALSVIDEENLQQIATDLGISYVHRTAEADIELPAAPESSVSFDRDSETAAAFELYPFLVGLAMLLLAFELARATMLVTQLRSLSTVRKKGDTK